MFDQAGERGFRRHAPPAGFVLRDAVHLADKHLAVEIKEGLKDLTFATGSADSRRGGGNPARLLHCLADRQPPLARLGQPSASDRADGQDRDARQTRPAALVSLEQPGSQGSRPAQINSHGAASSEHPNPQIAAPTRRLHAR